MGIVYSNQLPFDYNDTGVEAIRLVNSSMGAQTMTAGVAIFMPGASIPLHTHPCEETVIVLEGVAIAHIDGKEYRLCNKYDTTIVDSLTPHYFSNKTNDKMVIAYFYPIKDAPRNDMA